MQTLDFPNNRPLTREASGSFFLAFVPLQSSFFTAPAHSLSGSGIAYLGFRSSSRHDRKASTRCKGFQSLATFRPQAFTASRRFTPLPGSRACSIPQPRPGFSRPGASPPVRRVAPHRTDPTPMSLANRALTFRGRLPHSERLDFEALTTRRSVDRVRGLASPSLAPLVGFLLLQADRSRPTHRLPGTIRS